MNNFHHLFSSTHKRKSRDPTICLEHQHISNKNASYAQTLTKVPSHDSSYTASIFGDNFSKYFFSDEFKQIFQTSDKCNVLAFIGPSTTGFLTLNLVESMLRKSKSEFKIFCHPKVYKSETEIDQKTVKLLDKIQTFDIYKQKIVVYDKITNMVDALSKESNFVGLDGIGLTCSDRYSSKNWFNKISNFLDSKKVKMITIDPHSYKNEGDVLDLKLKAKVYAFSIQRVKNVVKVLSFVLLQ